MNWLFLTILAIVSRSTYSLATRLLGRDVKVSPQTQSFLLSLGSGLLALVVCPFFGGINIQSAGQNSLPFLLIIFALVFGNVIYFKGQKHLDAGITQIAFSSILIWGTVLSLVFLKSKFSLLQMAGILLMMAAIIIIQNRKKAIRFDVNILFIVISSLLFSIFQVASATVSAKVNTGTYLVFTYLGSDLMTLLIYFKTIRKDFHELTLRIGNTVTKTFFASGTSFLYFIFSFLAYRYAPDRGIVVILLTAQVVLSVIFGIIFLKEKDHTGRKLFAGALAFIAGILIKA